LEREGFLGPHINIVHGNELSTPQLQSFIDQGVTFSVTPENEMTQGHGHPLTGRLRDLGAAHPQEQTWSQAFPEKCSPLPA
jgi:hypothetical protein